MTDPLAPVPNNFPGDPYLANKFVALELMEPVYQHQNVFAFHNDDDDDDDVVVVDGMTVIYRGGHVV